MLDERDTCIRGGHLPRDFVDEMEDLADPAQSGVAQPADARLADIEASAVAAAMQAHGGNVSAARALGVSCTTVYRKLRA